jgi:hypothetical protein
MVSMTSCGACGHVPDFRVVDLKKANTPQIHCAAIYVLVQPRDEGVLVIGVTANKNPVSQYGKHMQLLKPALDAQPNFQ